MEEIKQRRAYPVVYTVQTPPPDILFENFAGILAKLRLLS
jgi:hypothetical protein